MSFRRFSNIVWENCHDTYVSLWLELGVRVGKKIWKNFTDVWINYSFIISHFIGFQLFLHKTLMLLNTCTMVSIAITLDFDVLYNTIVLLTLSYLFNPLYYLLVLRWYYMLMIIHEFWWFLFRIYIQLIIRRVRKNWRNCELCFLIVKLSFDFTGKFLLFEYFSFISQKFYDHREAPDIIKGDWMRESCRKKVFVSVGWRFSRKTHS